MEQTNINNPVCQAFLVMYEEYVSCGENEGDAFIMASQEILDWVKPDGKLSYLPESVRTNGILYLKENGLLIK